MTARTNLRHPDATVLPGRTSAKPRVVYRVLGIDHMWGVHNNDLATLERGVMTRIFYVKGAGGYVPPPQPVAGIVRRLRAAKRRVQNSLPDYATPLSGEEFVSLYKGRKRTLYDEAWASIQRAPVSERDAILASFIKLEKINFQLKSDPDPRIINPRKPRYNVAVGRYLKPMEHRIYKAIDRAFSEMGNLSHSVAKCRNFEQRAWMLRCKWLRFKRPVAVMLDCSRFDQHVRRELLRMEHSVYKGCYANAHREILGRLLRMQEENRGVGRARDGLLRWRISGMRASGDMNTAVGNVLQVCIALLCLRERFDFEVADDGDDCVVVCEEETLAQLQTALVEMFTAMGHELRVDGVARVFEQIKFCQCQPVFDGDRWTMVRDPHTAIAKDLTTTHDLRDRGTYQRYVATIGEAGLHLAGGIPLWDAFYRRLYDLGAGAKPIRDDPALESGFMINSRLMDRTGRTVSTEARLSFWRAFGVQPATQLAVESAFKSMFEHGHSQTGALVQGGLCL